ncbi:MAG: RsmB/NOP family class I SAM-dependent RNA methyltransferase [Oscillatoriales cyanobacterium C42_A2020_001]|nr:RsmB/NOP family class I SAM-dependent RNA methyltransferase [Leptolyngbyaceae cyanobacterium C42_A2020_001]
MGEASRLLVKLSQRLFQDEMKRAEFCDRLIHPQPLHPCILWCQSLPELSPFAVEPPLPWQPNWCDRLAFGQQPGKHPLHDQGAFYCLDFSSIFAVSTLLTIPAPVKLVVDVCAAPGGKSIFAWRELQPDLLISNEVIGKRIGALLSNLKRCQIDSARVTNLDPQVLAENMPQTAQVVLVDAPCTGQSLIAKGGKAPGCFHPVTINNNANRQKRILANSAQLVAGQGYLAYMTCTYSPEENEQVAEWFLTRFPQFQPVAVPHLQAYQSHLTDLPCYRLFPQSGLGAGAFTLLLQNTLLDESQALPPDFLLQTRAIAPNSSAPKPDPTM